MCYCCRKLDFETFSGIFVRPCEAVWGRGRPCSSHWLRDLCQRVPDLFEPIRAPRPPTASHGLTRPHKYPWKCLKFGLTWPLIASASHNLSCDLSEPIRDLIGLPRPHRFESPIGLSRTPAEAMRLAVKSVRRARGSYCLARSLIGLTDLRVRSASQICEAVGVRGADRPLTHTGRSDSGRSNAFSHEISQAAPRIGLHCPVCVRGRSAPRTPTASQISLTDLRVRSASHFGLPRPHRSDSLTDLTLLDSLTDLTDQIDQMCHKSLTSCCKISPILTSYWKKSGTVLSDLFVIVSDNVKLRTGRSNVRCIYKEEKLL